MSKPVPAEFECAGASCNECCKVRDPIEGRGYVPVTAEEVTAMAGHLGVDEATFKSTYMNAEETGLLVDPETGVCKLWAEGQGCTVYPVKPQQCTDFPVTWRWRTNRRNAMYAAGRCPNFKYPRNMT